MNFLTLITSLSPFAAGIAFVVLGEYGYYHPGWLIFLIIPAIGYLHESNKGKMLLGEVLLIGGALAYLYIIRTYDNMDALGLFAFAPLLIAGFINGNIKIWDVESDVPRGYKITVAATALTYLIVSFLTGAWLITWLIVWLFQYMQLQEKLVDQRELSH